MNNEYSLVFGGRLQLSGHGGTCAAGADCLHPQRTKNSSARPQRLRQINLVPACRWRTASAERQGAAGRYPANLFQKELAALRRRVGLVFQDPEQQLILSTPIEDISFGLRGTGMDEAAIQKRCLKVLEQLNLLALQDKPVHQLSLGQKSARRSQGSWRWSQS